MGDPSILQCDITCTRDLIDNSVIDLDFKPSKEMVVDRKKYLHHSTTRVTIIGLEPILRYTTGTLTGLVDRWHIA